MFVNTVSKIGGRRSLMCAALAAVCLMVTAVDAEACGRRSGGGLFHRRAAAGSSCGSCGGGSAQASFSSFAAPSSCPTCPLTRDVYTLPYGPSTGLPGVVGVPAPQFIPDATKSVPVPMPPLTTAPSAPTDLQPAYATDPATGRLRHVGWLRGAQFIPLQP